MAASTLARLLTSVVVFVVMARAWGAQVFGVFAYPLAIATIAVMVTDYGFALQVVRSIASRPADVTEIMRRSLAAKWMLAVAVIVAAGIATPWLGGAGSALLLTWLLLLSSFLSSFASLLNLPFRGLARFEDETKVVVIASVLHFGLVSAVVELGGGPIAAGVAFVVSRAGYLYLSLRAYERRIKPIGLLNLDVSAGLQTLRDGLPYGVFVAMGTLYFQIDTLLVQYFLGPTEVGLFQAAVRLLMATLLVPDVICGVYLPVITGAWEHDIEESRRLGRRMTRHLLMFGIIGFAMLGLGAQWLVPVVYGHQYDNIVVLLPALGLVVLLRFVASAHGLLLTISGRQALRTAVVIGAVVVSLATNVALIPRFGLRGAVFASVGTHVFLLGSYLAFVRREFRDWFIDRRSALLVGLAVVTLVLVSGNDQTRALGIILISVATILIGMRKNEWRRLAGMFSTVQGSLRSP